MIKYALKVFDFIRIRYPKKNFGMSFYLYPLICSILVSSLIIWSKTSTTSDSFVVLFLMPEFDSITTFIQVLPGFYIGALAAIASFQRDGMDDKLPTPTPYLMKVAENGEKKIELSRRTYLTLMFAYLASVTIMLAISIFFLKLFYALKVFKVSEVVFTSIYAFNTFAIFFFFFQTIVITLVGIYYLGNRMHRNI